MSDARFRVRATRANPPALAAAGERRATYGAALAQFDELMSAAEAASPASRPLPLFYALSQAGRAIAAAHAHEPWRLMMHGLTTGDLDVDVPTIRVCRAPAAAKEGLTLDSFSGVAAATGSVPFDDSADIGELWSSLPEAVSDLADFGRPRPLLLVPDRLDRAVVAWGRVEALVVGFDRAPEELVPYLQAHFPTAGSVRLFRPQGVPHIHERTRHGYGVRVWWEADEETVVGHLSALEQVAPEGVGFEDRWLRPVVGGVSLTPLLTWWALLFGLSMLARYEPGRWVSALAYDSSPLAAPLERLLTVGTERVPELVLGALLR